MRINTLIVLLILLVSACKTVDQLTESSNAGEQKVYVVGAMRNVMWKGELAGTIILDTIQNKRNLYGLGPVEYMKGELLILDGKSYKSSVGPDSSMQVEETYHVKAPFFVYANVEEWNEEVLPDTILTIKQLEEFIDRKTVEKERPFAFKLKGQVEEAQIHIQNLPEGTSVSSPDDAHKGQKKYSIEDKEVEIVGFFSTEHKGIFTHHDSFLHMHLITTDKQQMGHMDDVVFEKGKVKLYLPKD